MIKRRFRCLILIFGYFRHNYRTTIVQKVLLAKKELKKNISRKKAQGCRFRYAVSIFAFSLLESNHCVSEMATFGAST